MADEQLKIDVVLRNFASKELKKFDGDIARFGKGAVSAFKGVANTVFSLEGALAALGVGLSLKELVDTVRGVADSADKINDLNQRLGITHETLSTLAFQSKQTGVEFGELEVGLRTGTKLLAEFAETGKGEAAAALELLGPGIKEAVLAGKSLEELLPEIGRELGKLSDSSRVLAASKLFGRAGANLIPLLTSDLDKARESAEEFGVVIGRVAAEDADNFNDAIVELKASFEGLVNKAILPLLPELTSALKHLTTSIKDVKATTADLIGDIGSRFLGLQNLLDKANFFGVFDKQKADALAYANALFELESRLRKNAALQKELARASQDDFAGPPLAAHLENLRRMREEFRDAGPPLEAHEANLRETKRIMEEYGEAQKEAAEYARGLREEQEQLEASLRETSIALEAQSDAWRRERDAIYGAQAALRDIGDEFDKWGNAAYDSVTRVADALASNTTDALLDVVDGTKTAKEAFRDFGRSVLKDIARIIIQLLVMKAIEAGSGLGGLIGNNLRVNAAVGGLAKGGIVGGHLEPVRGHLADGGIVRQRGLFELREGGRNEAVIPLPDNRSVPVKMIGGAGGGGGSVTQNIYVTYQSSALTTAEEGRMIQRNMRQIAGGIAAELKQNPSFRETVRAA